MGGGHKKWGGGRGGRFTRTALGGLTREELVALVALVENSV